MNRQHDTVVASGVHADLALRFVGALADTRTSQHAQDFLPLDILVNLPQTSYVGDYRLKSQS